MIGSTSLLLPLLALILFAGCGHQAPSRDRGRATCDSCQSYSEREEQQRRLRCIGDPGNAVCHSFRLSIIELLANPLLYDGQEVTVAGYSEIGRENHALYLDAAEAQAGIPFNALWLASNSSAWPDSLNNVYIMVQGTFHAGNRGHLAMFAGEIEVHRVVRAPRPRS